MSLAPETDLYNKLFSRGIQKFQQQFKCCERAAEIDIKNAV